MSSAILASASGSGSIGAVVLPVDWVVTVVAVEELVHRHVDERRAAVRRAGEGECLVDRRGDVVDLVRRHR